MIKFYKLLLLSFTFFALSLGSAYAGPKKVGFIYIGPPGDHGWTYEHDQGRKYSINKLDYEFKYLIKKLQNSGGYIVAQEASSLSEIFSKKIYYQSLIKSNKNANNNF